MSLLEKDKRKKYLQKGGTKENICSDIINLLENCSKLPDKYKIIEKTTKIFGLKDDIIGKELIQQIMFLRNHLTENIHDICYVLCMDKIDYTSETTFYAKFERLLNKTISFAKWKIFINYLNEKIKKIYSIIKNNGIIRAKLQYRLKEIENTAKYKKMSKNERKEYLDMKNIELEERLRRLNNK